MKGFRLMANRSATWADFDIDALALEFADLKALNFDMSLTGFDQKELVSFMASTDPTEDEVPPMPDAPITKPGDLWVMGGHVTCPHCGTKNDV
jgi:hypothetical protein